MATFLGYSNFNGKNGDKFSADLLYDIIEKNEGGNYYIIRLYGYIRSWGYSGSGSYATFYINGENSGGFSSITANQYSEVARRDVRVDGDAEGNCVLNWSLSVDTNWTLGDASASGSLTLDKIPRKSSVGCTDGNIESTVAISINRASDSFTHTLRYDFGNLKNQIIANGVGTSYPWPLPTSFYNQIPNAKSGIGTLYCDTYSGSTLIGTSYCNFTVYTNKEKCTPKVSATIVDTNIEATKLTGSSSILIKGISNPKITTTATAMPLNSGATIKNINVECGDGKSGSGTEVTLNGVDSGSFTISATDSRTSPDTVGYTGYTNPTPMTLQMIPYVDLTLNPTFYRPEPTTGEVKLKYDGNYFAGSFGAINNSLTVKYRYKESTVTSWDGIAYTTITSTIDSTNNRYSNEISLGTGFDYQKSYDFEIIATDKLNSVPKTAHVSEGIPMLAMFKDCLEAFGFELVNNRNGFVGISDGIGVDNYSTEEIIVGKWKDGKPIYRKTIILNDNPSSTSPFTKQLDLTNINMIRLNTTHSFWISTVSGNSFQFPYYDGSGYVGYYFTISNGIPTFNLRHNQNIWTICLVLEYTKK